tara:strand:- start:3100 stop:3822 length:723 start_codon:yes stop_codon:yes gene_type:complete
MGKINLYYENTHQPSILFKDIKHTKKGVKLLIKKGEKSQKRLVTVYNEIKKSLKKQNINSQLNNPGTKTYDSCLDGIKRNKNQILKITDIYRASILIDNKKDLNKVLKITNNSLRSNNFEILRIKNRFTNKTSMGYKDINIRIKDLKNDNLIGELQINLCSIQKFNKIVGHKSYEIIRSYSKSKNKDLLEEKINKLMNYGYKNSLSWPELNCLEEFKINEKKLTKKKTLKQKKNKRTKKK